MVRSLGLPQSVQQPAACVPRLLLPRPLALSNGWNTYERPWGRPVIVPIVVFVFSLLRLQGLDFACRCSFGRERLDVNVWEYGGSELRKIDHSAPVHVDLPPQSVEVKLG